MNLYEPVSIITFYCPENGDWATDWPYFIPWDELLGNLDVEARKEQKTAQMGMCGWYKV